MKKAKYLMLIAGLMMFQTAAHAEMLTGTITNIDMSGQKVTLRRVDTNKIVTVKVNDVSSLNDLKAGTQVTLDARHKIMGGWQAKSIDSSSLADLNAASSDADTAKATPANAEAAIGLNTDNSAAGVNANAGIKSNTDIQRDREMNRAEAKADNADSSSAATANTEAS